MQNHQVNTDILNEISSKPVKKWPSFSTKEFKSAIAKYNNSSTPGSDSMLWKYLKLIVKDNMCLNIFVNITNTYINLDHWLSHFRILLSIIISKPNKASYNSSKIFCPIVLLNILGKHIKKFIGERLQF